LSVPADAVAIAHTQQHAYSDPDSDAGSRLCELRIRRGHFWQWRKQPTGKAIDAGRVAA
jgi:hypothetical protein